MRRREFIAGLTGAAAWPLAAGAQQTMPVVGYFSNGSREPRRDYIAAFLKGLAETGFVDGRNVAIEYRRGNDQADQLPIIAAELVRRKVAVIAAPATTGTSLAAKAATQDIPIVFMVGSDPVEAGLVASFNRPGGNLTGFTIMSSVVITKRLEMLRQFVPSITSVAYLINPTNPALVAAELPALQAATRALNAKLLVLNASTKAEIEDAFDTLVRQQAGALLPNGDPFFSVGHRDQLIRLANRHRIPVIFDRREAAVAGGLASYGTDVVDAVRLVGVYTVRILKGEKPANLPLQQVTKFQLVINLKTAKLLGIDVQPGLLAIADEVIE